MEFTHVCCNTWEDRLLEFKEKYGLLYCNDPLGMLGLRIILTRPARIEQSAVS